MTIFKSHVPDAQIPLVDSYTYIFGSLPQSRLSHTALIDAATGATTSYAELIQKIDHFAAGLKHNVGINKWDVVGIFSPNCVDYPVGVFGTLKVGCSVTLINPTYTADEVAYQLKDAEAKYLITFPPFLPIALTAAQKVGIPPSKIFVFGSSPSGNHKTIYQISSTQPLPRVEFTQEELTSRPAYLCYSSGTTGRSKGVETTHFNMVANATQIDTFMKHHDQYTANEVWTGVLPFYHIYGLNLSLHVGLHAGVSLVVFQKFDLVNYLEALQKYRVTFTHIVPPIIIGLAKHPIVDNYNLSSLRNIMSGAAPLSGDIARLAAKRLNCTVLQGFGMTESSPVTHTGIDNTTPDGSIGVLLPNVQARLVNPDTDKDVGVNERGELWVRGPNVMKGYHNNPTATADTIDSDGWLHTGDIAYVDTKGYFYIVDRLKELIKYKGLQVPPAELEGYLLTHPAIADAAVISRPDERAGELPRAYVVLKPGAKATEKEIQGFIEAKVAQHKRLRGGVGFIAEIPKAASGKILRRVLREMDRKILEEEARLEGKAKL